MHGIGESFHKGSKLSFIHCSKNSSGKRFILGDILGGVEFRGFVDPFTAAGVTLV
jgi:hypothetical protein